MINHSVRDLPLSDAREATAVWLTRVLSGEHLRGGEVSEVVGEVEASCNATISRLRLPYTPGSVRAGGAAPPERLLLKIVTSGHSFTDGEVAYYSTVIRDIRPSPAPACFHVAHCPNTGHY